MSASYLPKRDGPHSEHKTERKAPLPVKHTARDGYASFGHFNDGSHPANGKEQVEKALDLFFRRKWIVLVGFLVALVISVIYTMTRVPQYEAASFVMVDLGRVTVDIGRRAPSGEERPDAGFDLFARSDRSLAGEIQLLQISDQLEQRVLQQLQQDGREELPEDAEQPFSPLGGQVQFAPERRSDNIIRFTGKSSEAARAALLANLYAEEYVQLTQEASRSHALALRESLEEKEQERREELDFIEEQIKSAMQAGAVGLDQEASRLIGQIASSDVQREEARINLRIERASLVSLQQELETFKPQLVQRTASGVERRLQTLHERLANEEDARAKILLENPELRERKTDVLQEWDQRIEQLHAEIDSLSFQLVGEVDAASGISGSADGLTYLRDLRRQIGERHANIGRLEARLEALESRLRSYQSSMANIPEQSMALTQLERSRLRAEQMYQNIAEQLQAARIAEGAEPGYAQLISAAQVPDISVYPDSRRDLILGAFFGLLLGLMLAVVRDKLDNRIYQTEQLRQKGLKEIGVIPDMKPLIKEDYSGNAFLEHNGQHFSTSLISLLNPISATSEAYRYLRTNIQFGLSEKLVQTLLISSPGVSEGKSTTAANLAIVMAQAGRRTLLVDADLRRPQLHRMFGLRRESGLIELLSNGSYFDPVSWKTYIDNLFVLTAGSPVVRTGDGARSGEKGDALARKESFIVNSSELLGSEQMQEVLAAMRETFDIIIIDTPPVLAATDAALLASQSDATLIIARAGVTKESELGFTVEALEDVGATVIGILLNGFDIHMAYGHKYRYQHYTKYGRFSKYGYYGVRDGE